jgi:hypothetical protein
MKHLGRGCNGTVFEIEVGNGNHYAIKFQYGPESTRRSMIARSSVERDNLKRLKGVRGIPQRPVTFPTIFGTFDELGFGDTGVDIKDTVDYELYLMNLDELRYGAPLVSGLVPNATQVGPDNKQPSRFFDELGEIQKEVHGRGLLLPVDLQTLESDGEPHVVDWHYTADLKRQPRFRRSELARLDRDRLTIYRQRYQEGFDEELSQEVYKSERRLSDEFFRGLQIA